MRLMHLTRHTGAFHPNLLTILAALVLLPWAGVAFGKVTKVVVGITPTCPYRDATRGCYAGAYVALRHLDGVKSVDPTPDPYNCTAEVHLKGEGLPDLDKWLGQFKEVVDEAYRFRGVEVTVVGSLQEKDGRLVLTGPAIGQPLILSPLRHKLQWNFKKDAARQPEPDEKHAHQQLEAKKDEAAANGLDVEVTGPLRKTKQGLVLEVREWFFQKRDPVPVEQN